MTFTTFTKIGDTGKTTVHEVRNSLDGSYLGRIRWHGAWRKYVLDSTVVDEAGVVPRLPIAIPTIWSADCLADVQEFIRLLMEERRLIAADRRREIETEENPFNGSEEPRMSYDER